MTQLGVSGDHAHHTMLLLASRAHQNVCDAPCTIAYCFSICAMQTWGIALNCQGRWQSLFQDGHCAS